MVVTVTSQDPRSIRALDLLATAERWQKGHTRDGRKFYAIPSQSEAGLLHMTNCRECSCQDFQRRQEACKHVLAVRLHVERVKATQPKPKSQSAMLAHERRIGKVFQSDEDL